MTSTEPLNPGLYRVHRIFYIAFAAFAAIMLLIGALMLVHQQADASIGLVGLGLLPFAVLHWYAANGVKNGKIYARIISRIIGTVWLLGFPIGTALGIYVWSQTGKKWQT